MLLDIQVEGDELGHRYRLKVLLLGLVTGMTFVAYERFLVPHKSLDEDPVVSQAPRSVRVMNIQDAHAGGSGVMNGTSYDILRDPGEKDFAEEEDEDDEEEEEWWICKVIDKQPTILPKLFHKSPLYHQGTLLVEG